MLLTLHQTYAKLNLKLQFHPEKQLKCVLSIEMMVPLGVHRNSIKTLILALKFREGPPLIIRNIIEFLQVIFCVKLIACLFMINHLQ